MGIPEGISASKAFGFFTGEQVQKLDPDLIKAIAKTKAAWLNMSKILGYIPLVGIISNMGQCIVDELEQFQYLKPTTGYNVAFTLRVAGEAAGVGALFLLPDIIVSIGRVMPESKNKQREKKHAIPIKV